MRILPKSENFMYMIIALIGSIVINWYVREYVYIDGKAPVGKGVLTSGTNQEDTRK